MMLKDGEFARLSLPNEWTASRINYDINDGVLKWVRVGDLFINFDSVTAFKFIETDCEEYKKREKMNHWFTPTTNT